MKDRTNDVRSSPFRWKQWDEDLLSHKKANTATTNSNKTSCIKSNNSDYYYYRFDDNDNVNKDDDWHEEKRKDEPTHHCGGVRASLESNFLELNLSGIGWRVQVLLLCTSIRFICLWAWPAWQIISAEALGVHRNAWQNYRYLILCVHVLYDTSYDNECFVNRWIEATIEIQSHQTWRFQIQHCFYAQSLCCPGWRITTSPMCGHCNIELAV